MRRVDAWSLLLVVVLAVALGVLATLQVRWINEMSAAHAQRTRAEMETAARRFSEEIDRELMRAAGSFLFPYVSAAALSHHYAVWRAMARDPRFIAAIYVIDGESIRRFDPARQTLDPVDWPPVLAPLRQHLGRGHPAVAFEPDVPAMIIPVGEEHAPHGGLVVQLDSAYLTGQLFPELSRRYFGTEGSFDVAVVHGGRIVYRSSAWPQRSEEARADVVAPLFFARHHEEWGERHAPSAWTLLVRHHGAPLEEAVGAVRRRNLAVAFAILLLLAASLVVLAAAARRAERLRRQQLEFVAGITHELNTPLAALGAAGQNLADAVPVDTAAYGAMIVKETRRLNDLVDQVLRYAGIESGAATRRDELVDTRAAIDEALSQCRWLAGERGVRLETTAPETLPSVRGDFDAIARAVQNLVANAIRHGSDGAWVGVRASAGDGFVDITVEDRGAGIAAADLPHLFEPFYRGANAQTRGSGLGLTIVDAIVRAHGGSVTVTAPSEGGAAFTLRLPAAAA